MSKIKICGLTREEDIRYVNECLPDYIGFVFAESRRQVDRKQADRMREKLDGRICPVGVFVNESADIVASSTHAAAAQSNTRFAARSFRSPNDLKNSIS